ncbi:phosphatase PAP2 family protein [Bacillus sp. 31A1R]|uniref:Phosphatase PAP2 family protein n=1 Tax=Robertmurraya mangrovi TaxID=3098077 RepID=A0ABU5ISU0_9BACI|nr:phosphatase PAP2 family protein [Bacillus sp. 31A1R]MDZ5470216.1 phosphatase PAP2 family protein [Bacillus sp. 31A1R]
MGVRLSSKLTMGLLLIALVTSILLTNIVLSGEELTVDTKVRALIISLFGESTQGFFSTITPLGDKIGVISVGILFLLWLWWKSRDYIGLAVGIVAVALGNELNKFLKATIGRPRPEMEYLDHVESLSFPSGHAMIAIILYTYIAYFSIKQLKKTAVKWIIGLAASVVIMLIGISRVVLQVHYPTDVIGGFAIGYIWIVLLLFVYEWVTMKMNVKKDRDISL